MRALIVAAAVCFLAGCGAPSMGELRGWGSTQAFGSKKTSSQLSKCVQGAWQSQSDADGSPGSYVQSWGNTGYTVVTKGAHYFVDIEDSPSGSMAKYYVVVSDSIAKSRLSSLQGCL